LSYNKEGWKLHTFLSEQQLAALEVRLYLNLAGICTEFTIFLFPSIMWLTVVALAQ
jgi:hypothetical protein